MFADTVGARGIFFLCPRQGYARRRQRPKTSVLDLYLRFKYCCCLELWKKNSSGTEGSSLITLVKILFGALGLETFLMVTIKDGAYYCYCAYVLRISRYSDFLSLVLINTGIFLRGSRLWGESRT